MTYIKRMELHGFKSFAHKTVVDIPLGFNVFVGSNGSGKSNVIDALCFVLGKTSKKSMRADMLTDLIFNGGKEGRASKFAEVSLVFDNEKRVFPYEGNEFKITRRVLEKGNSIFKINEQVVNRQEILNALSGSQLDPNGFNIILQGDIQKFVDLSSEERRQVIEDVSGISIYEEKKKKSISEMEKVEEKLREARARLAERERYLKEIINDKKQAEKYIQLQDDLKDKRACMVFRKITEDENERTDFDNKINANNKLLGEVESKINNHRKNIDEFNKELENVKDELAKRGDAEQQALARKVEEVNRKKIDLENAIGNHNKELTRIKQRREGVTNELKNAEQSIKNIKKEINEITDKTESLKKELDTKRAESGIDQESQVAKMKTELLKIEEELSKLSNDLLINEQSRERLSEIENSQGKLEMHTVNLKRIDASLDKNETKRSELYGKRKEVEDYLNHLNQTKMRLEAKKDSLLEIGGRGVRSVMKDKEKLPGIHGTIASLGVTDKRFVMALNVAAGNKINAIVTSDDDSAQKSIEYLRQTQMGTASFIPLNKAKGAPISEDAKQLKKQQGVIDFAVNLMKFDDKYRKAFEMIFRDTLVVHDLPTARRLGFDKIRVVTLEGDLLETTGLMTGGYRGKTENGFMSEDIDKQVDETGTQVKKYEHYRQEISDAISILDEDIIKDREERARLESLTHELSETINRLKPRTEKLIDSAELKKRINELNEKKTSIKKEMTDVADERVLKIAKEEIASIEEEYNRTVINKGTKEAELEKVLLKEKEKFSEIIKQLDNELATFRRELDNAKIELLNVNKELKTLKDEESVFYKELKDLYDKRDQLGKNTESSDKEIRELEKSNYTLKEKNQELNIKRASVVARLDGLRVAFEEFKGWEPRQVKKSIKDLEDDINKLDVMIRNFGPVNMKSIETYKEVEKEFDEIKTKTDELGNEKEEIIKVIGDIDSRKKKAFIDAFKMMQENFARIFANLSPGGIAKLILENMDDPFLGGVSAIVRPKGKKVLTLKSMSGGEKTLTALAFIFALQEYGPTPFYIMDEVDAALDRTNTEKLAEMLAEYSKKSQFIVISHNDDLISAANYLYGISMDKQGVSNVVSLKLPE